MARLSAAPAYDRFAHWSRGRALALVVGFGLLLLAAVWSAPAAPERVAPSAPASADRAPRDTDLRLYDRISERVAAGESYYAAATEEQRARNFPVRPGLAVRLPTLALLSASLGNAGMMALAALLGVGVAAAWWRRLGDEPGGAGRRLAALLLLAIGTLLGLKPQYLALHEVWAGLLLALGGGLHRPGRWHAAWLPIALALAIRELALPFVLLLAAMAMWRRDWRETAAWTALVALFAVGLAWHLDLVGQHLTTADRPSPSWLAFRGLAGWTGNIIEASVLQVLPYQAAAPLALLPLLGWAGWNSPAGRFHALLFAGYGLFFMLAGRAGNFYWALIVVPAWFVGYAFLPMALRSLLVSAASPRA